MFGVRPFGTTPTGAIMLGLVSLAITDAAQSYDALAPVAVWSADLSDGGASSGTFGLTTAITGTVLSPATASEALMMAFGTPGALAIFAVTNETISPVAVWAGSLSDPTTGGHSLTLSPLWISVDQPPSAWTTVSVPITGWSPVAQPVSVWAPVALS